MTHPRPIILADKGQLVEYLDNMKSINVEPVVAGLGQRGRPFLAQLVSLNGEPLYEVVRENPAATKTDARIGDEGVCPECAAVLTRMTVDELTYPVTILTHDIDVLIPEGGQGEPIVEQPPALDERIEDLVSTDEEEVQ